MASGIQQFIDEALDSTFHTAEIPVKSLPDYFDALERALRQKGKCPEEVTKQLGSGGDLRAICPRCSSWVDTSRIAMLSTSRLMARGSIYGPAARLASGLCQNPDCPETHIVLMWRFHQPLRQRIDASLNQEELKSNRYLQQVLSSNVLAYTHDVLFNQTRLFLAHAMLNKSLPHLYKGMQFLTQPLWVFGSVFPWSNDPRSSHQSLLGQGYLSFFENVLQSVGYYTSETSVLHWAYLFDWAHEMESSGGGEADRSRLFIGFFAPHNSVARRSERGIVVLPFELLTESEISYVEGKKDAQQQGGGDADKPRASP